MIRVRPILLLCLLLIAGRTVAQTCTLVQTDSIVCAGTTVNFAVSTSSGTPATYSWAFGDGFTASTATPGHTYILEGSYTPSVTVTFSGGASCSISGNPIRVFAKPNAKFTITSDDTLCFKNNNLCILDQSTPGNSNAPLKKRIFQLSNGYIKLESSPPFNPNLCYQNTTDIGGHLYSLVLEVTDTNNCVDRLQKTDSVLLLPQMPAISYSADVPPTCYTTTVTFTNHSSISQSRVKSFQWDFGDTTFNTSSWASVNHTYTGKGMYAPKLMVTDMDGCSDTAFPTGVIQNIIPDSTIYLTHATQTTQCFRTNRFDFESRNVPATTTWTIYDMDGNIVATYTNPTWSFSFPSCGMYRVYMKAAFPDCTVEGDTIVQVYGPKTRIEDRSQLATSIVNTTQCEIFDTIYFKTPVPYLTCSSGNGAKNHLWDFGDAFAPPCTTDTKNGVNVGMNCNFSLDSMEVKHAYTPGKEGCYKTLLTITDPATGCWSYDSVILALKAPDAGPDTNAVPPRRGLYFIGNPCIGSNIRFVFNETLPECGHEKAWLNFDSACGINNFVLVDTLGRGFYDYTYNSTCDPDGWITVGLIIKNGNDRNGNPCYDTAWYHYLMQMVPINANLSIQAFPGCAPYTVEVKPNDSIQYKLAKVKWDFLGPADTIVQVFGPNDSIINKQQFTYEAPGAYEVAATYTNVLGCGKIATAGIGIGYKPDFAASKQIVCVGDSVTLGEFVRYYKYGTLDGLNPVDYWGDTSRVAANKEKVWWDLGDGRGFAETSPLTGIRYAKPGKYTIKLAMQDSLGCLDTVVRIDYLTIVEAKAHIAGLQSAYYCAPQIVAFKDSTVFVDSLGNKISVPGDAVATWDWDFGDQKTNSVFSNPAHNFTSNGEFTVRMVIQTVAGCVDTATAGIEMKGPQPWFVISDTLGCEPFTTTFINTTADSLRAWTWYFGDTANQTLTVFTDTNVNFTYTAAGVYNVRLLGVENVFNPNTGNVIICNSFFPDQSTGLPERKVYVMGTPPMDVIVEDTVCPNEPLLFTAVGDAVYNGYKWTFGDGGSYNGTRPDTTAEHIYQTSGIYQMQLIPVNSTGFQCVDTVRKSITALSVEAKFVIDSSKAPEYTFINQSVSGVRYVWDFGKPDAGASNSSTAVNGSFSYRDTGTYIVCLTTYNKQECWDSVCEPVHINQTRLVIPNVFTPDNNDNKNDAFDIDILGYTRYELAIYNRWGALVYESVVDGIGNDGINWNGLTRNEGEPCPAGTYYFIFTYQLITESKPTTVHGTITLIRDK